MMHAVTADHVNSSYHDYRNETTEVATQRISPPERSSDNAACLKSSCIESATVPLTRAFPDRTNRTTWCRPLKKDEQQRYMRDAIVFIKVPKAASTTASSVALNIGRRGGCAVRWRHVLASQQPAGDPKKTFLFASVRDPGTRAISMLFFRYISKGRPRAKKPEGESLIKLLRDSDDEHSGTVSEGQGGFTLRYLSLHRIEPHTAWNSTSPTRVLSANQVVDNVRNVINSYDFLMVVERMNESLVAMALIMGIDIGDVLTTSSKVSGSSYHLVVRKNVTDWRCVKIVKSVVSPSVQKYLDSDEWRAQNYGDYLLHAAANKSLDLTIERLGRERFSRALAEFNRLRQLEKEVCAPFVQFPCSNEGLPQREVSEESCFIGTDDVGCGYRCIDELLANVSSSQG